MVQIVAVILGVLFILLGLLKFVSSLAVETQTAIGLSFIYLISGAVSFYFGLNSSRVAAKILCLVLGFFYISFAFVGFWFGYLNFSKSFSGTSDGRFALIPGIIELDATDQVIHFIIAIVFLAAAFTRKTRKSVTEYSV